MWCLTVFHNKWDLQHRLVLSRLSSQIVSFLLTQILVSKHSFILIKYCLCTFRLGGNNWDCAYVRYHGSPNALRTVAYVMAGVCGACLIPLFVMIVHWQYVRWREERSTNYGLLHEDHTLDQPSNE
jgi:hypothetical protein